MSTNAKAAVTNGQDSPSPAWGAKAPRGAKTVFSRIVKEGANVPLFLSQTLVNSLRDVGYNSTTSAICEFIDNSVQWGATECRVYFNQRGRRGNYQVDVAVLDNGSGMNPNVLKAATAFGGSMLYDNRDGIGRYGMGMKAAALSMGPALEIYSWQQPGEIYQMILDVEEIGNDPKNVVSLPSPKLIDKLPLEVATILTENMHWPKAEDQDRICDNPEKLPEVLGKSGTVIYIPNCDRLSYRKAKTLGEHAIKDMARIYRRFLAGKLNLLINNRAVEPFDPTYREEKARHVKVPDINQKRSRLMQKWEVPIEVYEGSSEKQTVTVRLYYLPIDDWGRLSRKVLKNDLRVYDSQTCSFMRSNREVHSGHYSPIVGKFASSDYWWRLEIDFPAILDEAFGVSFNKQGVRPKGYVCQAIKAEINKELRLVKEKIFEVQRRRAAEQSRSKISEAEKRANEADAFQATLLPDPEPRTEEERLALEEGLKTLALDVKHGGESPDEAYERIKKSRYVTTYKHDEDAAFYRVDYRHGKVILTINTAHPFFEKVYQPLVRLTKQTALPNGEEQLGDIDPKTATDAAEALVGLQLLFFSLGRTQSVMCINDESDELESHFNTLRRQWSLNLETQLKRS